MDDKIVSMTMPKRIIPKTAYYLIEKHGGFELRKLSMEEDIVLQDEKVSDPDGWDQIILLLEQQLSKQFQ